MLKGIAGGSATLLAGGTRLRGLAGAAARLPELPVLSQPAVVTAYVGDHQSSQVTLARTGSSWKGAAGGVVVEFAAGEREAVVALESPAVALKRLHLRWRCRVPGGVRVLGDAWERSYGDLAWRPLEAERVLPWYAMLELGGQAAGVGVKTGAGCFAFWQVDAEGISLWLDVRNGGDGVRLGARRLEAVSIVTYRGGDGESAFSATRALCRRMAQGTKLAQARGGMGVGAIYGSNDWYYAYGKNTPEGILRDADLVRSLAPAGAARPFTVIDDGYQDRARFPDMRKLAEEIRGRGVVPGVWIRPLRAAAGVPEKLLLPASRWKGDCGEAAPAAYDPTIPEAMEAVGAVVTEACGWGYELIKHDFTTFELLGQWGSQMGASPANGDWHFNDRSLTNAEIVSLLYRRIRGWCGEERLVLGCNTVGHLSVGLFDASRTGDDVSGREWERTRRCGVNTLAFRLPQHRTFFALDADCVPLTRDVPWSMTRQWLDAVARSGTVLLISPEPGAVGAEHRAALRDAFAICVQQPESEPVDWLESRTPGEWRAAGRPESYEWTLPEGESPFPIGIQRGPD